MALAEKLHHSAQKSGGAARRPTGTEDGQCKGGRGAQERRAARSPTAAEDSSPRDADSERCPGAVVLPDLGGEVVHDATLVAFLVRQTLLEREKEKRKEEQEEQVAGAALAEEEEEEQSSFSSIISAVAWVPLSLFVVWCSCLHCLCDPISAGCAGSCADTPMWSGIALTLLVVHGRVFMVDTAMRARVATTLFVVCVGVLVCGYCDVGNGCACARLLLLCPETCSHSANCARTTS